MQELQFEIVRPWEVLEFCKLLQGLGETLGLLQSKWLQSRRQGNQGWINLIDN